jgi:hypothetical protein
MDSGFARYARARNDVEVCHFTATASISIRKP